MEKKHQGSSIFRLWQRYFWVLLARFTVTVRDQNIHLKSFQFHQKGNAYKAGDPENLVVYKVSTAKKPTTLYQDNRKYGLKVSQVSAIPYHLKAQGYKTKHSFEKSLRLSWLFRTPERNVFLSSAIEVLKGCCILTFASFQTNSKHCLIHMVLALQAYKFQELPIGDLHPNFRTKLGGWGDRSVASVAAWQTQDPELHPHMLAPLLSMLCQPQKHGHDGAHL